MSTLSLLIGFTVLAILLARRMRREEIRQRVVHRLPLSPPEAVAASPQGAGSKEYKYHGSTRM